MRINEEIENLQNQIAKLGRRKQIVYDVIAEGNKALGLGRQIDKSIGKGSGYVNRYTFMADYFERLRQLRVLTGEMIAQITVFKRQYCDMAGKILDEGNAADVNRIIDKICKNLNSFHSIAGCKRRLGRAVDGIYSVSSSCELILEQLEANKNEIQARLNVLSEQ